jgi:hypothetical protein
MYNSSQDWGEPIIKSMPGSWANISNSTFWVFYIFWIILIQT